MSELTDDLRCARVDVDWTGPTGLMARAADRIEELERQLARTRRAWVAGDDPLCEDVCLDVCQGPCGIGGVS